MMTILKEFVCKAHGPFEEFVRGDKTPKCPKGCSPRWVTREIRTAPAAHGHVTGQLDLLQKDIAKDFRLRDIKVDKEGGGSVMNELRKGDQNTNYSAFWSDAKSINTKEFSPTEVLRSTPLPKVTPNIEGRHRGPLPEV
jgi:hypothetical protein